ncbi:hypothetical protein HU200_048674 [Digitaria exilis]|uniref:Disease resistance N-terminal domain-containing protein n=1 Tax=Digitaria exilis TaxID=1010633 RepID=A0A835AU00_9POAL|nr:hypothetical protein HU200_048674 [Digitaria exilis]
MEATALSVGKSVLNGALGYAKSALAEEVALQLGVQQDQAFITDELEMMQSFMMEAHEERDNNKVVKTWVKQRARLCLCCSGLGLKQGKGRAAEVGLDWWPDVQPGSKACVHLWVRVLVSLNVYTVEQCS